MPPNNKRKLAGKIDWYDAQIYQHIGSRRQILIAAL